MFLFKTLLLFLQNSAEVAGNTLEQFSTMGYFVWVTSSDIWFSIGFGGFAGVSIPEPFPMNIAETDRCATTHETHQVVLGHIRSYLFFLKPCKWTVVGWSRQSSCICHKGHCFQGNRKIGGTTKKNDYFLITTVMT